MTPIGDIFDIPDSVHQGDFGCRATGASRPCGSTWSRRKQGKSGIKHRVL